MAKQQDPPAQTPAGIYSLPTPPLKKATEYLNLNNSWVYASMNAIAQEVANIKLHLYSIKRTNKGANIDEIYEHEAISLLNNVNDFMTSYQLLLMTEMYLESVGEAYWLLLRNPDGTPNQIWILRPDWVWVVPDQQKFIKEYKYSPMGAYSPNAVTIPTADIVPFKDPNLTHAYRGKGTIQAGSMPIDIDQFSDEWNRTFFYNSAIPYLILRTKRKPKKEEMDRFMEQWNSKLQGRNNSSKVVMLNGDWDNPFVFGDKMKDMDFIEQKRMMRDQILATFRVPKSIIGVTEDVNRANAEASTATFMSRVIVPKMRRLVAHLNEFYLANNWKDEDIFFDFEDPTPEDAELKIKIYESAKNSWMTTNEIREKENLPPVEGGDVIYQPIMLTPIGSDSSSPVEGLKNFLGFKNKDKEKEMGIIKMEVKKGGKKSVRKFMMPIPPKRLAELREEKKDDKLKVDVFSLVKNMIEEVQKEESDIINRKGKRLPWSKERRLDYSDEMIAKALKFEKKYRNKVEQLFTDQEKQILENLNDVKWFAKSRRTKDRASTFLFNIAKENKKWEKALDPIIRAIVVDKGKEILSFLGISGSIDLSVATAVAYLKIEGLEFIKGANEYTIERLKKELGDGLERDEGIPDLKKRVENVFEVAKGSRAEKIARTETIRSTNFATEEAFRQSDIVEAKEWLTARDDRVDSECEALDGKIIDLEKGFSGGVDYPPLHPNCRCTILPVLK